MLLKTGLFSVVLLLSSRLLGLLRESAQAAAFGTSGMGDVAVLMLTLPDWLTGILASGALTYVLLPHWAGQSPAQLAQSQRHVARWLLLMGAVVGLLLYVFQTPVSQWLASGLPSRLQPQAAQGLVWSAAALPAALLAALWVTRLQHERDFTGLYAANLVVSGSLVIALYLIANDALLTSALTLLGLFLWLAMGLRLLWLHWRLQAFDTTTIAAGVALVSPLPRPPLWLWAALSAGLPLTLPFVARSFASSAGEGALVTFNYAWKLVELPLVLAIQLVATLSFPAITRAMLPTPGEVIATPAGSAPSEAAPVLTAQACQTIRGTFLLAWTLACACAAALQVGAPAIANWLFGWGRMPPESLATIATWGAIGAFALLPQALIAVALMVLASLGQMRPAVLAYGLALVAMLFLGIGFHGDGAWLMGGLNAVLCFVALIALLKLPRSGLDVNQRLPLLPWQAMLLPATMLLLLTLAARFHRVDFFEQKSLQALLMSVLIAILVVATSYFSSHELRTALRR